MAMHTHSSSTKVAMQHALVMRDTDNSRSVL